MKKNVIKTVMSYLVLAFITGHGYSQQNSFAGNKNDKTYNNTKIKNNMVTDTTKAYASVNGLKIY